MWYKDFHQTWKYIEEYFYRIQKLTLNKNSREDTSTTKYLARIITDMLLLTKDISYEDMHRLHYRDILDTAVSKTHLFSDAQKQVLHSYFQNKTRSQQNTFEAIDVLHQTFTHLLITHHATYTHNN